MEVSVRHCYYIDEMDHTWTEEDQLTEERIEQEFDLLDVVVGPFVCLVVDGVKTMYSCCRDDEVVAAEEVVGYRAYRPYEGADKTAVHKVVSLHNVVAVIVRQEEIVLDQSETVPLETIRCDRRPHLFFHDDGHLSPIGTERNEFNQQSERKSIGQIEYWYEPVAFCYPFASLPACIDSKFP
jgi:hypothetical protein